jgi:hypothetical protein
LFGGGSLLICSDKLVIDGPVFRRATTFERVVTCARQDLELSERIRSCSTDSDLDQLSRVPGIAKKSMSLYLADVTDGGMRYLQQMPRIASLHLGERVTNRGLVHLKWLTLRGSGITASGLRHLVCLKRLEDLALTGIAMDTKGLNYLARLSWLEELRLEGVDLRGAKLSRLASLSHLKRLGFYGSKVGDPELLELAGLGRLTSLDLRWQEISQEGLAALRSHLPQCDVDFR